RCGAVRECHRSVSGTPRHLARDANDSRVGVFALMRRVIAITLVLVACSKRPVQPSSGGRSFGAGGGAAASTGTDTTSTDTTGTLKGGAGGGPGSGLAGATITGIDTAGTQEWTPDVTDTTHVSTST